MQAKTPKPPRASIRDVASRAGVSAMTVSNVLRQRTDRISQPTLERVMRALNELQYIPVRSTVQNRHSSTNVLGVVFNHAMWAYVGQETFRGMSERAKELDYDLLMILRAQPDWLNEGTEAQFLDRRCDGYIFVGQPRPELSTILVDHGIPVVEAYSECGTQGVSRCTPDNAEAMRMSVDHLWSLGHRRIAHVAGPYDNGEADTRLSGYLERMAHYGVQNPEKWVVRGCGWDYKGRDLHELGLPDDMTDALLSFGVTGVVAANDGLAFGVINVLRDRGLRVPEDMSVVGMDDAPDATFFGLSTIRVPFSRVGRCTIDSIVALTKQPEHPIHNNTPVELIARTSTAPPHS